MRCVDSGSSIRIATILTLQTRIYDSASQDEDEEEEEEEEEEEGEEYEKVYCDSKIVEREYLMIMSRDSP